MLTPHSGAITGTPTAAGAFNFTVQATDSSSGTPEVATKACTITVAPQPDFALIASPANLTLFPGSTGIVTLSLAAMNGFSGQVALSVSRAPTGAQLSLQPTSISGTQTSRLSVNAGSAAAGTYSIVVTGTAGGLTHSTSVTLTITAKIALTVSPTSLSFDGVHHYGFKIKQIEVTNNGATPALIEDLRVKGDEAARDSFVPISLCGHMLQPAHACRIIVAFFAERLGRLSATLEVPVKSTPPLTVSLSAEVFPLRQ